MGVLPSAAGALPARRRGLTARLLTIALPPGAGRPGRQGPAVDGHLVSGDTAVPVVTA